MASADVQKVADTEITHHLLAAGCWELVIVRTDDGSSGFRCNAVGLAETGITDVYNTVFADTAIFKHRKSITITLISIFAMEV